jgi:hypothetical protein
MDVDYYRQPGPLTALRPEQVDMVRALDLGPVGLCQVAQGLFRHPGTADGTNLSPEQMAERGARPAWRSLARALELDKVLYGPRSPDKRVCGTCRHFAVMATALLRATGVAARARCGFATYFQPPKKLDHWVTEYWDEDNSRWVRLDPEVLGLEVVPQADDLAPGMFLTGGEAWQLVRNGPEDAADFGVAGTNNWGPAEVRGNLLRDLAALVKTEVLPWDEWGPMRGSYEGLTGEDFDQAMDGVADVCNREDSEGIERAHSLYAVGLAELLV